MRTKLNQAIKKVRQKLETKLLSVNVKAVIYNGSKTNGYTPYTLCVNDNLKANIEDTDYINKNFSDKNYNVYGANDLKDMSALASSAALTFNTFFKVSDDHRLIYGNNEYTSFKPEVSRPTLPNNHGGNAHIDAELTSENKILLIEMKMFEPYGRAKAENLDSYIKEEIVKDNNPPYNPYEDIDETYQKGFRELFEELKAKINNHSIKHYDAIQMAKHTLSIVNKLKSFPDYKQIELLSLTWYASETSMDFDKNTVETLKSHDKKVKEEAEYTIRIIQKALEEMSLNKITVNHKSYNEFIKELRQKEDNLVNHKDVIEYLEARYL